MRYLFLLGFILTSLTSYSQKITRQDSLRGSITPQRAWWDLVHYDLSVEVLPESKTIIGTNVMTYKVLNEGTNELQIDLQAPMELTAVMQDGHSLDVRSEGNAHFIQLEDPQREGELKKISLSFEGKPRIAKNPPWDGGITWKKDSNGKHFIASSNQGIGASVWWPNRDHPADEVDSLDMHVTVPKDLVDVSNGRLVHIDTDATTKTYHWTVKNPINNYGVNLNIGDYVNFSEVYKGEKGPLDMSYWVLKEDEEKAREQFKQAPMMMEAFEHWFGPYPFYEDSFKLVQAPYLGMEHQSSVTYGNRFKNGYLGRDLSGTGEGLKFDFI
ncbi:MAG: M1 family peptidase, partial [Dokdonia donghaensis]|nr:M1 family peptidase [Dokdonia donghaensis]